MPTVSPSAWGPKPQFLLASGLPAVGYKLFAYLAGSVGTKTDTYTNSTGAVANTNPVILDVNGTTPAELWFVTGLAYKVVYAPAADTDPPTSPIWTVDNVRGIGDATITPSEWVASSLVPTYLSATSFSLTGDQTATFQVGRRLKSTNTAGTIYSTIASSVLTTVTTVTVVNDSGALDSGLVAVSYGIISAINSSDPFQADASGDVAGPVSSIIDHFAQFADGTGKVIKGGIAPDTDGTLSANSDTRVATQKAVRTYVAAAAGTAGHVIEDEGTPLAQQGTLNFTGAGVAVTDAGGKTVVTIAGGASGDVVGPGSATDSALVAFDGTTGKLIKAAVAQPYELGGGYTGAPTASVVLLRAPMCRTVTFAAGLSPSHGVAGVAATAQTDFDLKKNNVSFGTMRFAAAGTVASFISAGGSTPVAGDVITVVAPGTPDATLADIGFILAGTR